MYIKTRQNLAKNLIYTRPAFQKNFSDVYVTLFEMSSRQSFVIPKVSKFYELEEFARDQKNQREEVKTHYNDKVDEIIKKLETLV